MGSAIETPALLTSMSTQPSFFSVHRKTQFIFFLSDVTIHRVKSCRLTFKFSREITNLLYSSTNSDYFDTDTSDISDIGDTDNRTLYNGYFSLLSIHFQSDYENTESVSMMLFISSRAWLLFNYVTLKRDNKDIFIKLRVLFQKLVFHTHCSGCLRQTTFFYPWWANCSDVPISEPDVLVAVKFVNRLTIRVHRRLVFINSEEASMKIQYRHWKKSGFKQMHFLDENN